MKSLISYIYYEYFQSLAYLHLHHSDFGEVQMIIFPIYVLYSYVLVRKSLLNKSPPGVSLTVSSRTITVIVPIMFISIIHFEYIFNVGYGSF